MQEYEEVEPRQILKVWEKIYADIEAGISTYTLKELSSLALGDIESLVEEVEKLQGKMG